MEAGIYDTKYSLKYESQRLEQSDLNKQTKRIIRAFIEERKLKESIGEHRQIFYASKLRILAGMMGTAFLKPDDKSIKKVIEDLDNKYDKINTRNDYKLTLKRFYRWYIGKDEETPKIVRWIKKDKKLNNKEKPEPILTKEEIRKLIDACVEDRDKAMIALLYDSGCRIGELLTLRLKDIQFDKSGAILSVTGKTGPRIVRVVHDSVKLMHEWISRHPSKEKRDSYLFIDLIGRERSEPMSYAAVARRLQLAAKKAKLKRKIHPHLFRHTRATILARNVAEAPLELQMGWVHGSEQSRTYVHLSGRDQDIAILKAYGISVEEEKHELELPVECPRCRTVNVTGAQFCTQCSLPLSDKAARDFEDLEKLMRLLYADHIADTQINNLLDAGVLKFNVDKNLKMLDDPEVQHMLMILRKKTDGLADPETP